MSHALTNVTRVTPVKAAPVLVSQSPEDGAWLLEARRLAADVENAIFLLGQWLTTEAADEPIEPKVRIVLPN